VWEVVETNTGKVGVGRTEGEGSRKETEEKG